MVQHWALGPFDRRRSRVSSGEGRAGPCRLVDMLRGGREEMWGCGVGFYVFVNVPRRPPRARPGWRLAHGRSCSGDRDVGWAGHRAL